VNLAPAEVRKTGSGFDLAIAVATLAALGAVAPDAVGDAVYVGELSLVGSVQPVRGLLPLLLGVRNRGARAAVVASRAAREAGLVR
ncbi:magnesium chelatase domain-containing protein, partial [Staphylococcus aureus]